MVQQKRSTTTLDLHTNGQGRGRLQDETTVVGRKVDEERDAAEEIACHHSHSGCIAVGLQQRCRRLRRLPHGQYAGRDQKGVPVERLVRIQLTAPDERWPEVGQRQELAVVRAVVQDRRHRGQSGNNWRRVSQAGHADWPRKQLRFELQLRRDIRQRLVHHTHGGSDAARQAQDGRGLAPRILPGLEQVRPGGHQRELQHFRRRPRQRPPPTAATATAPAAEVLQP